jgi:hypothetical protein
LEKVLPCQTPQNGLIYNFCKFFRGVKRRTKGERERGGEGKGKGERGGERGEGKGRGQS